MSLITETELTETIIWALNNKILKLNNILN